MALPDSDELFLRYFAPWYTEEDRTRRVYPATRPDIEELGLPAELQASHISPLTTESQTDVAERIADMLEAAAEDWKGLLGVQGSPSMDWLSRFDGHFQDRRLREILDRSDPQAYDNDYLVLCSELGAVLGAVLQTSEPRLAWIHDWPYWESALYDRQTGARINIFHWAVKKMSNSGIHEPLVEKTRACLTTLKDRR